MRLARVRNPCPGDNIETTTIPALRSFSNQLVKGKKRMFTSVLCYSGEVCKIPRYGIDVHPIVSLLLEVVTLPTFRTFLQVPALDLGLDSTR